MEKHLWHSRWLQPELQAFPSQVKTNSEAIKMSTHAFPAEHCPKVGGGGAGMMAREMQKEEKKGLLSSGNCY